MPEFLDLADVARLHAEMIEHYGGDPGLRGGGCSNPRSP